MLSSFLSCQAFGVPDRAANTLPLDIVRNWSGQTNLVHDNSESVHWVDTTRIESQSYAWIQSPPPANIPVRNALVRLGGLHDSAFFAFISPLPGIPEAFKAAASEYFVEKHISLNEFELIADLRGFLMYGNRDGDTNVTSIEVMDAEDSKTISNPRSLEGFLQQVREGSRELLGDIRSVGLRIGSQSLVVDQRFNARIDDLSSSFEAVSRNLVTTFSNFAPFLEPTRQMALEHHYV